MERAESQGVEFKESWRDEHLKTLCAFANTEGGTLYIGISDSGEPVGVENAEELLEVLPNKIRNRLGIIASVDVEDFGGKRVLKIVVRPSDVPISYNGRFYVRSGSTTQEVNGLELLRFVMRKQGLSWDSLLSDAGVEEVDEETIYRFVEMAGKRIPVSKEESLEKILENLELIRDGKLTNAGVLLFGRNPQKYIRNSVSRVGRFKTPTEVIDTIEIKGNLFKQVDELVTAIKKHLNVRYEIEGIERRDVWDYPLPAIREACINALIHRDYTNPAEIQVKIYDNRIWIWNPGGLPEGITVESLRGEHISRPRNKLLAMVFYYAGLIEKWGTGTTRIIELCRRQGLPEPEFKEEFGGFSLILRKDVYDEEYLRSLGLNERQIRAVFYVKKKGRITNSEYQRINGVKKRQASEDLKQLEEKGILVRVGTTGKGVYYVLKGHQRGERGAKGASKGRKGRYIIRYYCTDVKPEIERLLGKIKEKHEIDFEVVINAPWDEEKDREVYERYFKPRSRILRRRVGKSITKLRSRRAKHYFVSVPGTIAIFKGENLEYWELATEDGVKLLRGILAGGERRIDELLKKR